MKSKNNHPESFEEIIFKNRNKAYGAFLLRSSYARTVAVSVTVTVFVFSFAVSWAMWNTRSNGTGTGPDRGLPVDTTIFLPPDNPPELPPKTDLPAPEKRLFKPVVVDSAEETTIVTQGELGGNVNPPVIAETGYDRIDSVVVKEVPVNVPEPETPFLNVPEMPEFPGGDAERITFLKNNLTYPNEAKEIGLSGTVYVGFIVERDGSISNITVLRGVGGGCDEEAVRVVQMMPKWKPGRQQGHEVRVRFTLPIKFTLH